jgi:tRNA A-37 threonylcarbamoyl transferase component Bud32
VSVQAGILPDRYANARLIGQGGTGRIYLAEDRELGRRVAIKVLDDRFASDEQLRERFKREALTAARLSGHPHVVTIFDVGEWQGRPFIVMEYLPGGTLGERTRRQPVAPDAAVAWLAQAAQALDDAHGLGIVHRDVKPANLLFDERDDLAVADFGIARIADDTESGMTATGTVLGTAGYLAPEQALGQPAGPRSDLYSLGVVGYELLTGGRPFERGSDTAEAAAHINEPVPPASERRAGLPSAVDRIFERALAKHPRTRYASGADFVGALGDALSGREGMTRVLPAAVPAPPAPPRVRRPPPSPQRRRPPWMIPLLLALLVLALAAGALAALLSSQDGSGTRAQPVQQPVTVTAQETVGSTVATTVVTTTAPAAPAPVSLQEAVQLTDEATQLLEQGQWEEALQTQRRALRALEGTYRDDFRYEAYAAYNMGKALAELGRCGQAVRYLDRSEELQGHRHAIDEARKKCEGNG